MVADLSKKLVNSFLILLISRFLGVSAMGSYSIAHTYFSFGLLFSYWGFGNLLTREVAKDKTRYSKYLSNFSIIRIVFALISILIINILVINLDYIEQTKLTIQILSIGIIANTIINLIYALFISFEKLKYLSIISLIVSILRVFISYLALKFGGSVVTIAFFYTIMEFISLLISILFALKFLKDFQFNFDFKFCIDQIIKAFPFFWIAILVILDSRVEVLIISFFYNESYVGYYTAMNTVMGGVALFSEGVRNAVFPIFARYQYQFPERLGGIVLMLGKYISLVTFPVAISIFFFAEKLISLFFNFNFDISTTLLQIVIWTFISYTLTVVTIRLLMVHNKEKKVVLSLLISSILTLVLNILLAPTFGLVGIATVRLITSVILLLLCLYFLSKQGYKIIDPTVLLRISIASVALFLSVHFLFPINPYFSLVTGYLFYAGVIWLTKVISPKDIQLWKEIFNNIFNLSFENNKNKLDKLS